MIRHISRAALLLTGLALLLTASPAAAQSDTPGDLTDSLVACWDMDEASGVRYDSWGDHHLTDNNTVGAVAGLVGGAAAFDAYNREFLSLAHSSDLFVGDRFAVYAIVDIDLSELSTADIIQIVGVYGEQRLVVAKSEMWGYGVYDGRWNYSIAPYTAGWHILTGLYNGNDVILVVDGQPADAERSAIPAETDNPLYVGYAPDAGYISGSVDTTAVWQRTLTADERLWLYNDGAGRSCEEIIATAPQPVSAAVIPLDENTNYIIEYTFSFGEIATVIALSLVLLAIVLPKILEVVDRWFP